MTIDRRGEIAAGTCAGISLLGTVVLAILAVWSHSAGVFAAAAQMLGACGIWMLSLIHLHQQRLVAEERLEVAELERQRKDLLGGVQTIFDEEDVDQMEKLAMGRRLRSIERFLAPVLALGIAAYHVVIGWILLPWSTKPQVFLDNFTDKLEHETVVLSFLGAIAFCCYMLSRYAMGMSRLRHWTLLRAGGNYLFGSSVVCLAGAIALLCYTNGIYQVEPWMTRAAGALLCLLAVETVANFVLDFYRPRIPGQVQLPFYDSRLLSTFNEPGGILHSLADKIDYQFGFKVSETWFYKLFGKVVIPLLVFQGAVLIGLTSIVVVPVGHRGVVLRQGQALTEVLEPGTHATYPWPIDRVELVSVERVRRLELGHEAEGESTHKPGDTESRLMLWTKAHYAKEYKLLVADRSSATEKNAAVNLLSFDMPVQWRVRPDQVVRFYRQSTDMEDIIECLAYRELTRYAAGADAQDLLGAGGIHAAEELHERLQAACDRAGLDGQGLGVEIVLVGMGGVHPPVDEDVAKSYEEVINAYEQRDAAILRAEGDAAEMRINMAGTGWKTLYEAIVAEETVREANGANRAALSARVEELLRTEAGGFTRERTAKAEMNTFTKVFRERAAAEKYEKQLAAFRTAPHAYLLRMYLSMLVEGLGSVRKYVIAVDNPDKVLYEIDLKPPAELDVLGAETAAAEAEAASNQ